MKLSTVKKLAPFAASGAILLLSSHGVFAQDTTITVETPLVAKTITADPNKLIAFIINALIVVGIVLSLIFLIYGGIRWILSGGEKGKVDAARSAIVAAIVGLIIVILAWVIINTVLVVLTGGGLSGGFAIPHL